MPHALLLSPDDQAVSAITGVLDELSVTYERPLDGASAAQKLTAQSFDLVLVDCENLTAAKLIFEVCRRGKNGNNAVPIAIVDGRAGLPTAFRLGAELILTKPVAKDQARTTVRTAITRVRKDVPADEISRQLTSTEAHEKRARAAVAAASSQLTNFSEPAPALTAEMDSAVDEMVTAPIAPKLHPIPSFASPSLPETSFADPASAEPAPKEASPGRTAKVDAKSALSFEPSENPVIAGIEPTQLADSKRKHSGAGQTAPLRSEIHSNMPVFSSYQPSQQKPRGAMVAFLVLAFAAGGFYAAWTYQPRFRAIAEPLIDRMLVLAVMGQPAQKTVTHTPATPSPQAPPDALPSPAAATATDPNQTHPPVADSSQSAGEESATAPGATAQATPSPGKSAAPQTSPVPPAPAPVVNQAAANQAAANQAATNPAPTTTASEKKDVAAPNPSYLELPGEKNAIILTSKGAEKRLAYSVRPKFPLGSKNSEPAPGTVLLKVVIDAKGKVAGVRPLDGDARLATAAIKAVKQWRYRPYVRDRKAQPFQTVVILDLQRP